MKGDADVDLIDERQVFVALGILDFIDADRVDLVQFPGSRPQVTTCSTASKTLSQEVRKASAVSFQLPFVCKCMVSARIKGRLDSRCAQAFDSKRHHMNVGG